VQDRKEREDQAVKQKATRGNFVGDVKIMCASGLPKVDYWGSIDP
jgi:hypothetical protein